VCACVDVSLSHLLAVFRPCDNEGSGGSNMYWLAAIAEGIEKGSKTSTIEDRYKRKALGSEARRLSVEEADLSLTIDNYSNSVVISQVKIVV